jgi:hypothetical protein
MITRAARYAMRGLHALPSREADINPNPQKGGYPAHDRVTFLTGANRDFSNWRRHAEKTRHLVLLVSGAHKLDYHFFHGGFKFVRYSVIVHQFEDCAHRFAVALDRARNKDLKNDFLFRKNFRFSVFSVTVAASLRASSKSWRGPFCLRRRPFGFPDLPG